MKLNLFIIIIVALPLLGSFVAGFLGRKIGVKGSQFITCFSLLISSTLISYAFYEIVLCGGEAINLNLGSWVDSGILTINWEFKFDNLSISLGLAVLFCSTLIHIYSISYLDSDPQKRIGKRLSVKPVREEEWVQLSNSGDTLKPMLPNYIRKGVSGWTNYSCKVITYGIDENKMGNRGSKSDTSNNIVSVKEQRVDGSWYRRSKLMHLYKGVSYAIVLNPMYLRCTLIGCESSYQFKIPSKQLNVKKYCTLNCSSNVNPWFWTGLIDAEGSFTILVVKDIKRKLGWRVESKFQIGLHKNDLSLLLQLQEFLGGIGSIHQYPTKNVVNYSIDSIKDLTILINHLEKYPLLTKKSADFILFKQVVKLMINKAHLTIEGIYKIINIKA